MQTTSKSREMRLQIPTGIRREDMAELVRAASSGLGLYISHVGGYSRTKYPGALHWHFKRDRKEKGVLDATYWEGGPRFWLIVRNSEPRWVHEVAPRFRDALAARISLVRKG